MCLSLYGDDKDITFYEYFEQEIRFFGLVRNGEHLFKVLFSYILPISVVLLILRAEKKRAEEFG